MHDHEPRSLSGLARHYLGDLVYGANDGIITTFCRRLRACPGPRIPARTVLDSGLRQALRFLVTRAGMV